MHFLHIALVYHGGMRTQESYGTEIVRLRDEIFLLQNKNNRTKLSCNRKVNLLKRKRRELIIANSALTRQLAEEHEWASRNNSIIDMLYHLISVR